MVRHLPKDRFEPAIVTYEINAEHEAFRSIPCPVHVFPLRQIYTWNGIRLALRLRRLIRSLRVDIVHTFFESSDIWGGLTARTVRGTVLVSSRRDLGIQRHALHDFAYRLISPLFHQVQAVSEEVRRYVIRADGLKPSKVVTVPNGVDVERAEAAGPREGIRAGYGIGACDPVITCVANVRRIKGIDVLVEAAGKVCGRFPNARFLVAGKILETDYMNSLKTSIARLGLEDNIRFLGKVEDVFGLLKASDVFFLPSHSEGMSNAVLEAMACSLPAVTTRVGGNLEVVQEGKTGLLVPPGDADAAAARLLELLADHSRAAEMGRAGRELVESEYSVAAVMKKLIGEYEGLLKCTPAGAEKPA